MTVRNDWLARYRHRPDATLKLICLPHAGGSPATFRLWADAMTETVELSIVCLPARDSRFREEPLRSVRDVVEPLALAILELADRPYAIYGHSLGALLAFEAARELRRKGAREPEHLLVAASPAPQLPWPHPPLRHLAEDVFLDEIQRRYGKIPAAVLADRELLNLLLPGLRADIEIIETYWYGDEPPLACPITAYGGALDEMVPRASLDAWRVQTAGAFQLHTLSGGHFALPPLQSRLLPDLIAAPEAAALRAP